VARYLKHCNPGIRCLVAEPKNAALLSGKCSVPGRHKLQGLGYTEVPRLFDRSLVDGYLAVTDAAATRAARLLAREEGILAGYTSGPNVGRCAGSRGESKGAAHHCHGDL
jgi:cysteine synthase